MCGAGAWVRLASGAGAVAELRLMRRAHLGGGGGVWGVEGLVDRHGERRRCGGPEMPLAALRVAE